MLNLYLHSIYWLHFFTFFVDEAAIMDFEAKNRKFLDSLYKMKNLLKYVDTEAKMQKKSRYQESSLIIRFRHIEPNLESNLSYSSLFSFYFTSSFNFQSPKQRVHFNETLWYFNSFQNQSFTPDTYAGWIRISSLVRSWWYLKSYSRKTNKL